MRIPPLSLAWAFVLVAGATASADPAAPAPAPPPVPGLFAPINSRADPDERDLRDLLPDPVLPGTTDAPDGWGRVAGLFATTMPKLSKTSGLLDDVATYTTNATKIEGLQLGTTFERRHLAVGFDLFAGGGHGTGTLATAPTANDPQPGATPYTATIVQTSARARIGYRAPLGRIALAGGIGVGFDAWYQSNTQLATTTASTNTSSPGTIASSTGAQSYDWYTPLWVSATYKPTCDWGVEVNASYDVRPTDLRNSAMTVGAGIVYQPSSACSEPTGVQVI